ncbi:DUF3596 domain-containing protein [Providencia huaxiensis]|nr:DUF3596 domain-containing protein [Providencia huaxiensis]
MGQTKQILPRGVMIRKHKSGETINISFTFKGVHCREPLSNLEVNPKNIKYAERLLGEIYNKIEKGIFSYVEYFPKSSKLKVFGNKHRGRNINEYLDEYLDICETRGLSPSTIGGYKKCKSALSTLHDLSVVDLTPGILKTWIQKQKTSLKTIRNQLSFLRSALDEAVTDGLITSNPANMVTASRYQSKNSPSDSDYIVDPLTPEEVTAIYNAVRYEQWKNLFQFAINTGLPLCQDSCRLSFS